jgi:hypothetical protein
MFNRGKHRFSTSQFLVDANTPSQKFGNLSQEADGGSACGPFVWLMAEEFVQWAVEIWEDGKDVPREVFLPMGFAEKLGWDSGRTRQSMQNLVNREIRVRNWLHESGRAE